MEERLTAQMRQRSIVGQDDVLAFHALLEGERYKLKQLKIKYEETADRDAARRVQELIDEWLPTNAAEIFRRKRSLNDQSLGKSTS